LLALAAAAAFAYNNAGIRRGVLTGSVTQGMAITVPTSVPVFFVVALASGYLGAISEFSVQAVISLSAAGILSFVWARYCNYRATKAIGMNLVAPLQQIHLVVSLILAVAILGEKLTALRGLGIALVFLGPAITTRRPDDKGAKPAAGVEKPAAAGKETPPAFKPNYAEGYTYALLSTLGFGLSPILVRHGLEAHGLGASIAGGLIASLAAAVVMGLVLLWPGRLREALAVKPEAAKWFTISGVLVCLSQMLLYMAMSIAPVSVVLPISRLSILFRLYFSRILNPQYEVFGGPVIIGTFVSLFGALVLSLSTQTALEYLPHWPYLVALLNWHWP
jgi:uncharacterized membrane protein